MNIYGIIVGVRTCEIITLQIERMNVSHNIFQNIMYKLAIVKKELKSVLELMVSK